MYLLVKRYMYIVSVFVFTIYSLCLVDPIDRIPVHDLQALSLLLCFYRLPVDDAGRRQDCCQQERRPENHHAKTCVR